MNKLKASLSIAIAGGFLLAGAAVASAALDPSKPDVSTVVSDGGEHPECQDATKANDPADFCYQTIGEWNSRLLTTEEVGSRISSEEMARTGMTPDEIRQYHPEYTSAK